MESDIDQGGSTLIQKLRPCDGGGSCVWEEKEADELDYYSLVKGAARYAEQMDLRLQLEWPNPTCIQQEDETSREAGGGPDPEASGKVVTERGAKQNWHGKRIYRKRGERDTKYRKLFPKAKWLETMPTYNGGHVSF